MVGDRLSDYDDYKAQCVAFHKKRLDTATSAWYKLLSDTTYNRGNKPKAFVHLTDEEVNITAEALQHYLRTT